MDLFSKFQKGNFFWDTLYNVNMCCKHSQRKGSTFVILCKNFLHVKKLIISADESQWVAEVDVPDDRLTWLLFYHLKELFGIFAKL